MTYEGLRLEGHDVSDKVHGNEGPARQIKCNGLDETTMTVQELIDQLRQLTLDYIVLAEGYENGVGHPCIG